MGYSKEESIKSVLGECGVKKITHVLGVHVGRCYFQRRFSGNVDNTQFLRVIQFDTTESKAPMYRAVNLETLGILHEMGYMSDEVYEDGACRYNKPTESIFELEDIDTEGLCEMFGGQTVLANIVGKTDRTIRGYIKDKKAPTQSWLSSCVEEAKNRISILGKFVDRFDMEGKDGT